MNAFVLPSRLLVALASLLILAGCGSGGPAVYRVTGTIVKDGRPLTVPSTEANLGMVQVRFILLKADGTPEGPSYDAKAGDDGVFRVAGAEGRGIPPGSYRVAVYQYDPYPTDKLGGAFSEERSTVVRQIDGDTDLGEIDLSARK